MFADLCYFSVISVQLTFIFLVLPCLLLGYLGQAAYLMENHVDTTQAFFPCSKYGYKDVRNENHQTFEQLLMESLEKFIRREAQERSLESDGDDYSDSEEERSFSRILIAPNGSVYSLGVPLLAEFKDANKSISESSTSEKAAQELSTDETAIDPEQSLEKELSFIRKAKESGFVYLLGHGNIRARKDSWFIKKLIINYFYSFLRKNSRKGTANLSVPHSHLIQVGMTGMTGFNSLTDEFARFCSF